jgi:hypothetical protein
MTKLSPAAQSVLDAAINVAESPDAESIAAAVLRAVVEQCVPDDSEGHWVYIPQVLAIANELEGK